MFFLWSGPRTTGPRAAPNGAGRHMRTELSGLPAPPAVDGETVPGLAGSQECDFRRVEGSRPIGE